MSRSNWEIVFKSEKYFNQFSIYMFSIFIGICYKFKTIQLFFVFILNNFCNFWENCNICDVISCFFPSETTKSLLSSVELRKPDFRKKERQPNEVFSKKVIKNFTKFTAKHLCRIIFLIRLQTCNFIKKEIPTQMFSCEFCETFKSRFISRTPLVDASEKFLVIHCQVLLQLFYVIRIFTVWDWTNSTQ